jgi:hypothetical protein
MRVCPRVYQFGGYVFPAGSNDTTGTAAYFNAPSGSAIQLEDPLFPGANAAAACYAFPRIAALFEESKLAIAAFWPSMFRPTPLSVLLSRVGYDA